ncbi:TPA: hypothetical protein MD823_004534 [Klebsiella pneumoniae]|nr:hypothetical protein [Klebsiella pneumoniae]MCP6498419.1 hypothetical protein [Klebsiella pneumoniae]MCQ4184104.1 hypothetical protein [Klebsiella pneumoniae]HBV8871908.1 hypothetical protein [Klebsiella pneumoniae]
MSVYSKSYEVIGSFLNGYVTNENGLTFQSTVVINDYSSEEDAISDAYKKAEDIANNFTFQ